LRELPKWGDEHGRANPTVSFQDAGVGGIVSWGTPWFVWGPRRARPYYPYGSKDPWIAIGVELEQCIGLSSRAERDEQGARCEGKPDGAALTACAPSRSWPCSAPISAFSTK